MISAVIPTLLIALAAEGSRSSASRRLISATAKSVDGRVVYVERHEISLSEKGRPLRARTEYIRQNGGQRAELMTDLSQGLAAPGYVFSDESDGSSHGVEVRTDEFVVWKKSGKSPREEKILRKDIFPPGALVAAGQGLHFYLSENLQSIPREGFTRVKMLIPGRLDYYSFRLSVEKEDERSVSFKMEVDNMLLRLFVSSLRFRYAKSTGRLLSYSGLSNLPDEKGNLQSVEIEYEPDGQ